MDYRKFVIELVYNLSEGNNVQLTYADGRKIRLKPKKRFTCGVKMLEDCATLDFHKGRPNINDGRDLNSDALSLIASDESLMIFVSGESKSLDIPWNQLDMN